MRSIDRSGKALALVPVEDETTERLLVSGVYQRCLAGLNDGLRAFRKRARARGLRMFLSCVKSIVSFGEHVMRIWDGWHPALAFAYHIPADAIDMQVGYQHEIDVAEL